MQYESKKCQDQTGMKNDKLDDKTRWELMPLDCLEDIARVYTEGAKKYGDNTWQNLENGYERYKGALLRHLYAAESETFDEETGCRHRKFSSTSNRNNIRKQYSKKIIWN